MYTTKRFKFSSQPKKSYIDSIYAEGKKKQIGPLTYKNLNPRKPEVVQEDRKGAFVGGICKSNTEQG